MTGLAPLGVQELQSDVVELERQLVVPLAHGDPALIDGRRQIYPPGSRFEDPVIVIAQQQASLPHPEVHKFQLGAVRNFDCRCTVRLEKPQILDEVAAATDEYCGSSGRDQRSVRVVQEEGALQQGSGHVGTIIVGNDLVVLVSGACRNCYHREASRAS